MLDARRKRAIEPGAVEDQRRIGHALDRFQRREHLVGIGHLRHALGVDERAHLDALEAGGDQRFDKRDLLLKRKDALLVLQSVAQRFVFDQDFGRQFHGSALSFGFNRC